MTAGFSGMGMIVRGIHQFPPQEAGQAPVCSFPGQALRPEASHGMQLRSFW